MRSYRLEPDAFVLRTPVFSLDDFVNLTEGLEETADERLPADRPMARLRQNLVALLSRPVFREGLFLASPTLCSALESFVSGEARLPGALESAVVAYASRCCGRPTPFGLFAAYSVGTIDSRTSVGLEQRERERRHTQLHADTLSAIVKALERALERDLDYCVSSSLHRDGSHIHYIEGVGSGRDRRYDYVRVASTPPLDAVIGIARRPASFQTLVDAALAAKDSEDRCCFDRLEDAIAFVRDLIANSLLVSTLAPPVTGDTPLTHLLMDLERIPGAADARRLLADIRVCLARLDCAEIGSNASDYDEVRQKVVQLCGSEVPTRFHVDLVKPASNLTIGHNVVAALRRAVDILHRIAPDARDERLVHFATSFQERYGNDEIPLVEALDEERGLGFGERSADSIGLSMPIDLRREPRQDEFPPWTPRDQYLYERLASMTCDPDVSLTLDEFDLKTLTVAESRPLPESFYVNASIGAASSEAVDRGEFDLFVRHVVGPCGGRLLSRFAQMDPDLRMLLRRHTEAEERGRNELYAEIVHVPAEGLANVVGRPILRDYEIPFLGRSGLPPERQIPIDELTVTVDAGRIVLRWSRQNVEVAPRLSSAHNYYQRLPSVYQFLCVLQNDATAQSRAWTWGVLKSRDFLPRVTYEKLVFARARWRVAPSEISRLADIANLAARYAAVQQWRESRRMPRLVCLADADRELLIDFENPLSADCLLRFARTRSHSVFEHYPAVDQAVVSDKTGRAAHELITMWVAPPDTSVAPRQRAKPHPALAGAVAATRYAPGSEWSYLKVYSGRAELDDVLLFVRDTIIRPLIENGQLAEWFFIRYADPHRHLRLRLRVSNPTMAVACLSTTLAALSPAVESRDVGSVQIDTYFPELNRYGGPRAMELAHRIFAADSVAAADTLRRLGEHRRSWLRVAATFLSVDALLDDWSLEPPEKATLARDLKDRFVRVAHVDGEGKRSLGKLFRSERERVRNLVTGCDHDEAIEAIRDVLSRRTAIIRPTVTEIRQLDVAGVLSRTIADLLQAFVHLTVNRFLRNPRNEHELVIYDLLYRAYAETRANVRAASGPAIIAGTALAN